MKIIPKTQHRSNLIENILLNAGVKDIATFLIPNNNDDTDLLSLPNIKEGCNLIVKHLNNKIVLLVDSDCDGMTSSAIVYKYLKAINPSCNIIYYIHEKKVHGLTTDFMNFVNVESPSLVIVVDAGTNEIKQREELIRKGIDLLIIDHHIEEETTNEGGVLINNHANFPKNNINKNLTGATMAYLFCKTLDKHVFNTNHSDELDNLAMIGTIGDGASLIDNEVRNLCLNSVADIKCNLLKTLCYRQNRGLFGLTFTDLQFNGIISLINAIIRVGSLQDKTQLFKALIDHDEVVVVERMGDFTSYNIYHYVISRGVGCKINQDKIIKKEIEVCMEQFQKEQGIQICILENENAQNYTGLIASKLVGKWAMPVIVVYKKNNEFVGSMRGCLKVLPDFKTWCENTGLFTKVLGHKNASGVAFPMQNYNKILEEGKKIVPSSVYIVEKLYNNNVVVNDIYTIANNTSIFKFGIPTVFFGVKNLIASDCLIEYTKETLRITAQNGVIYIKFKVTEEQFERVKNAIFFDMVGYFKLNTWNGKTTPQFVVTTIHPKENEED